MHTPNFNTIGSAVVAMEKQQEKYLWRPSGGTSHNDTDMIGIVIAR